jgi:lycopene cyclase domain-containing protein
MSNFAYLTCLLVGLGGLAVIDWRYKLVWWHDARRTARTMVIGIIFFLVWDIAGVSLGIFFPGNSPYDTGLMLLPGVPIEELFFLTLLMYQTLILWQAVKRR